MSNPQDVGYRGRVVPWYSGGGGGALEFLFFSAPVTPTVTKSCHLLHQPVSFSSVGNILLPRIVLLELKGVAVGCACGTCFSEMRKLRPRVVWELGNVR